MAYKPIGKDATGYEILTDAMKALLNQYPGLYENETIKFEELGKESGIAFSADNGALVYSEKEDVLLSGNSLMESAMTILSVVQHDIGGGIVYLECEDNEKLLTFYQNEHNCFSDRKTQRKVLAGCYKRVL